MIKKIKRILMLFVILSCAIIFASCGKKKPSIPDSFNNADNYENIYQVFVRSYADSNNDGIGDFKGLDENLKNIKDLGFTALWLMPINDCDTYHGYDIKDYYNVNPELGTLNDFKSLLKKADDLDIDIYMDLVVNHTSNQNEWFQKALNGDEKYKNYYNFSKSNNNNALFRPTLNGTGYYYAYFDSSMPDLNLRNDEVINEIKNIAKFWIEIGVDGFRLDGALHYFRTDEYNHAGANYTQMGVNFIKTLQEYCESLNPNFNTIVEAWDTSSQIIAPTFRSGASPIDFGLSNLICDTATANGSSKFFNTLKTAFDNYAKYDKDYVPVIFLKNHDMDRLASWPGFDTMEPVRFAAEMLLSLPGSPITYYGEELGMIGKRANGTKDQFDETVRLPYVLKNDYQTSWCTDYNGYNNNIKSLSEQLADKGSLASTYKTLLNLRNNNIALKYGNSLEKSELSTYQVVAYTRSATYNNETQTIMVIHNISISAQEMLNVKGKLLYSTNNEKSLSEITKIKPKSTIIIDITEE